MKKTNRPIFNEAIQNAIENKVKYFIIFDIDRFSREWYWVYSEIKEKLLDNWIILKDSKNIIWDTNIVIKNNLIDMSQYKWNIENHSEYAEVMISTQAKIEWKKIIQRTIPKEIELEQMWYHTRQPNFWFQNKKIRTSFWKATIQIEAPIEWKWIKEIFEKRAKWLLTDKEIVKELNLKWFKKRSWKSLDVKYLQELIKKPIYAWIIYSKWSWYKPIKAAYKWLVDIEIWNKANKWKIEIIKIDSNEYKIIFNKKNKTSENIPIIQKRRKYNPFFPFSKIFKCPICNKNLIWSSSKWKNWELHHYYFCKWPKDNRHKSYTLRRNEVHNNIYTIFKYIRVNDEILNEYEKIIEKVYNNRKKELEKQLIEFKENLKILQKKEENIINSLDKLIDFPHLLEIKNKELEEIKNNILILKNKTNITKNDISLEKYKFYSKYLLKHLEKLVIQTEKPELIELVFNIIFYKERIYENIISQTLNTPEFSSILKQKNPQFLENFSKNLKWQSH